MLNIVTIEGKKYIVDVGFGSSGPTHPLPLIENEISTNVGDQEMRLLHDTIPDFTQSRQKLWIYQHRNGIDRPWLPTYAFSEMEFTPSDFEMMNYFTSSHRTSFFTYSVVCVKMILDEGEIVGDITLFGGEVKRRIKGKSEVLAICKGEEDRVKALEEFLGIKLSAAEREGIRGMPTELLDA
jgi:arylamine N-acetyltransferase